MSQGHGAELAPSAIVVNAAAAANGKIWLRRDRAEMRGHAAFILKSGKRRRNALVRRSRLPA
jgi:hypothetical protein